MEDSQNCTYQAKKNLEFTRQQPLIDACFEEAIVHRNSNNLTQKSYCTFWLTQLKGFTVGRRVDVPVQL